MNNHDLQALRKRLHLSRARLAALLTHPITKQTVSASTLYSWERRIPEVLDLPHWIGQAVVTLEARYARIAAEEARIRAKNPRFGDERYDKRGGFIWDGESWFQTNTWYGSLIYAKKKGEPLPLPRNEWEQPAYDKIFHRVD